MKKAIWISVAVVAVVLVWASGAYAATVSIVSSDARGLVSSDYHDIAVGSTLGVSGNLVYETRDTLTADVSSDLTHDLRDATVGSLLDKVYDSIHDICADATGSDVAKCDELVKNLTDVEALVGDIVGSATHDGYIEQNVAKGNRCQDPFTGNWHNCIKDKFTSR